MWLETDYKSTLLTILSLTDVPEWHFSFYGTGRNKYEAVEHCKSMDLTLLVMDSLGKMNLVYNWLDSIGKSGG